MKAVFVLLMIPFMALPSWAKITVFSNTQALSFLLNSTELKNAEELLSEDLSLKSVSISKKEVNSLNVFTISLKYSSVTRPPQAPQRCLVSAVVETKLIRVGSIMASELVIQDFGQPSCNR